MVARTARVLVGTMAPLVWSMPIVGEIWQKPLPKMPSLSSYAQSHTRTEHSREAQGADPAAAVLVG